jgi:hypothetical protein
MSIFRPGSTSPSAILYDAWESFTERLPKADENIRSIRPELAAAVDECIEAAGQEWEPYWQRRLLNVGHALWSAWSFVNALLSGGKVWPWIPGPPQSHRFH